MRNHNIIFVEKYEKYRHFLVGKKSTLSRAMGVQVRGPFQGPRSEENASG